MTKPKKENAKQEITEVSTEVTPFVEPDLEALKDSDALEIDVETGEQKDTFEQFIKNQLETPNGEAIDNSEQVIVNIIVSDSGMPTNQAALNAASRRNNCEVISQLGSLVMFKSHNSTVTFDIAGLEMTEIEEKLKLAGF